MGYAADPGPCIARLRALPHLAIAGNHDHAVTGRLNPDLFNDAARAAALWTARVLSDDEMTYLAELPEVRAVGDFTHVHGSLRDPVMEYLISEPAALATFALLESPYCLVGHSHYPIVWTEHQRGADVALLDETQPLMLNQGQRVIVNPGSVGQPRDGDWRASYLLYDSEIGDAGVLDHHRVEYDIATAQRKIRAAGLPESLADRLALGHGDTEEMVRIRIPQCRIIGFSGLLPPLLNHSNPVDIAARLYVNEDLRNRVNLANPFNSGF